MGKGVSKLFSTLKSKGKEQRIVMLGLDNGGKTTMYVSSSFLFSFF